MNIAGPFFTVLLMAVRFGIWVIITFLKIIYKLRLTGIFLWICGLGFITWNTEHIEKYGKFLAPYVFFGILVVIGTLLAMFTAIDIVNIGLHFFLKNVRPYAASCSEA